MRAPWKKFMPTSLFGRSLLIVATPLLLTLAIGTFVFFDRHWSTTTDRLAYSMAGEIDLVADFIEHSDTPITKRQLDNFSGNLGITFTYLPDQTFIQSRTRMSGLPGLRHSVKDALRGRLDRPFNIEAVKADPDIVRIVTKLDNGTLMVDVPRKRLFTTTTYIFLLWMIGAGFFLFGIALLFMRNQVRPIKRLAFAVEQFGKGHDTVFFKPAGAREIRQAAEAFSLMRERIRRQIQQRTDMLAGVSHDLRTPLTRMNLQLAMMPQNADTSALQNDVKIMQQMIDEYLAFARGSASEISAYADLHDQLQVAMSHAEHLPLEISYTPPTEPLLLRMRPQAIQRVFANILGNAALHGRKDGEDTAHLTLHTETDDLHVSILFDDHGTGVPQDRREDMFRPFVRMDESRNADTGGTGLGLAIARDIVQSHGGTIELDDAPNGGLRVRIILPL